MQLISFKIKFLALAIIAIASTASGCTNSAAQNRATNVATHDHSMMNHDTEVDLGAADANYDLRFVDAMMMHHQGAAIMAEDALKNSKRPEIKQLANNILAAQNKEIKQMKQWRTAWYPEASQQPVAYGGANKSVMPMSAKQNENMMMSQDLGAADDKFDLRFLDAMIPHHEGALVMAKDALSKSTRPEVKQLNQSILTSQQAEIDQMQQWRKAWYNK
ncbi:MAG: DUF305 domain-containing protein [Chroococcus sp. CMT-3BRIN-NPC107]|jgi:uncharacterized protein (DUF305 family)|nr:DUF305 domain-containing protein [Chroococcus sp. CMT-3BRIN-NPC107]